MAYQVRQRDPIFDSNTQAAIERRGKELVGAGLVTLAVLTGMLLGSYAPEDPGWFSATSGPVENWLGHVGAVIASPLSVIIGLGAWAFAIVLGVWGVRFILHLGEDRALSRIIFAPIAIGLGSVYASTLAPGDAWTHSFGLGGLFGDTILGAILGIVPVDTALGLKIMSGVSGAGALSVGLFSLGFTWPELKRVGRFLLVGTIMLYAGVLALLGKSARGVALGAVGAAHGAKQMNARRAERREDNRVMAEFDGAVLDEENGFSSPPPLKTAKVLRAEPAFRDAPAPAPEAPEKTGLLARMPSLMRRNAEPEPELVETPAFTGHLPGEAGGEDRIKAKIADVLKSRARQVPILQATRAEPPVARAGGPQPMILGASQIAPHAPAVDDPLDAAEIAQSETADYAPTFLSRAMPGAPEARKAVVQHNTRKPVQPSTRAKAEAQPTLNFDESAEAYELPPLSLLTNPVSIERHHLSDDALEENARMLENVLDDYGVKGEIVSVRPGPVVTMYELEPAPGLKASRVIGLADDIARSMSALSARVSTVPGRSVIGIELPNANREKVVLREILSAREFGDSNMRLPLALGKDIGGDAIVANLAKMPHLLIAGTTGSGKSVAINTMILSLLYRLTPDECRLIMIDPKMLELSVYDGIPHLLSPVVTDPKKAVVALKWVVGEMEERYRKMSKMGVRNIEGYNGRVRDALAKGELFSRTVQTGFDEDTGEPIFETEEFAPEKIPYIVVVVDEMADLMMVAGKEIEACIQRLAQMARASGIHLIMATQRPSVDVITGTIKANFPTRISFQVTSKIDSRTILGEQGAEQLLGMGDMLYMAGGARITRVHGPFVSDEEVEEIVTHLKSYGPPEYVGSVVEGPDDDKGNDIDLVLGLGGNTDGEDALYDQAVAIVIRDRKCSTSYIQRKLSIGYNKAARLVEQMEDEGLVSASNHVGKREILVPEQQ